MKELRRRRRLLFKILSNFSTIGKNASRALPLTLSDGPNEMIHYKLLNLVRWNDNEIFLQALNHPGTRSLKKFILLLSSLLWAEGA